MASYKYASNNEVNTKFTIYYNITPDFDVQKLFIGDEITIEARITNAHVTDYNGYYPTGDSPLNNYNIKNIYVYINNEEIYKEEVNVPRPYVVDHVVHSGSKEVKFKIKLPDTYNKDTIGYLTFGYDYQNPDYPSSEIPLKPKTRAIDEQKYNLAGTRYNITILDFSFERASLKDGEYVIDNQGHSIVCKNFLIVANDNTVASDFQVKKIKFSSGDDVIFEKNLELSIVESAMSEGYSETYPSLFEGYEIVLSKIYRIDLILGNENEVLITKTTFVHTGYANMHLSGAKQGGVAIGGFSSSTDENPLFECFFPALFYNGFAESTFKIFGNSIYPVGAVFICNGETDPNVLFGGTWERLEDVYLRSATEKIGEIEGNNESSVNMTHKHIAPIGVDSGLVGAIEVDPGESQRYTVLNSQYANATIAHSGTISRDVEFYNTSTYTGSAKVSINPRHLNVAMWERKTLYDIEQDATVPISAMNQVQFKRLEGIHE